MSKLSLQFAKDVTNEVNRLSFTELLDSVTPTTRDLLTYWFDERYVELRGNRNFHEGQRQAILNTIYIHEVLKCKNIFEAYRHFSPDILLSDIGLETMEKDKYSYPKYCIKMATGTGKTWVLVALLIWQYLNAKYEEGNYSKNYLIVAPGLIVYKRLLDAFLGKEEETVTQIGMNGDLVKEVRRVFEKSDIYMQSDIFLPNEYRDLVFSFFKSNVVTKEDIGRKVTGEGMIAITNWHLLVKDEETETKYVPVRPSASAGNDLNVLDNRYGQDRELFYLRDIKDLVVFNDEAHHIHEIKKKKEVNEVEWQKSLDIIAKPKGERFIQIDFSATPYNQVGKENQYFPHIVVDFELKSAILKGLVKAIVLDQRKEVASLPLDFNAVRDENNMPIDLSEGQRTMLRAGFTKLNKLESVFQSLDQSKHPKMLVLCEDTKVAGLIHQFLLTDGIPDDDILEIHSNKKGEISDDEWLTLEQKLFGIDKHPYPRIIVSVLMLREGFDVNNICVIVPLRSTHSNILLEQTIGRGLRLMWREPEYSEEKEANRKAIVKGDPPPTYFDILSIIEHPAFIEFYKQFLEEGLVGVDAEEVEDKSKERLIGTMIQVGLRPGYEEYDLKFPLIVREPEELLKDKVLSSDGLEPITQFTLEHLKTMVPKNDVFISQELLKGTRFGDYSVQGGVMTATSYNEYISRLVQRIGMSLSEPVSAGRSKQKFPAMQVKMPQIAAVADEYIRNKLFGKAFDPFPDNNWRVLLVQFVAEHIIREIARAVRLLQETETVNDAEIIWRAMSEVSSITMRENFSIETHKTIYERTPYPSNKGGLEKAFIEYCETDGTVQAFVKLLPHLHTFVRLRYMKEDGLSAYYYPDFLVRCDDTIYLVETKGEDQLSHPNVRRKQIAAINWVKRVNNLPAELRFNQTWQYVLLGEEMFYSWKNRLASVKEILEYAHLRDIAVDGRLL